ncbi:hypothetical protein ANO11243_067640 [Dothideomycetidae sp. 11243]|nr:hypothetical protein ANO11243_067640 [fungal sp. No.11243]
MFVPVSHLTTHLATNIYGPRCLPFLLQVLGTSIFNMGIQDYLQQKHSAPEVYFKNIIWGVRDDPESAELEGEDGEDRRLTEEELEAVIFDGPVLLSLGDRYSDHEFLLPIKDRTVRAVLRQIKDWYKEYESTTIDARHPLGECDAETNKYSMGDCVFLECITYKSKGYWVVDLGS